MNRITRQIQPTPSIAALPAARLICGVRVMLSSEGIEFLVALNAREEAFLYEIYADLRTRLLEMKEGEAISVAIDVISDLAKIEVVELGMRNLSFSEAGPKRSWPHPPEIHAADVWSWPSPDTSRTDLRWFISLTGRRVDGRGLEAVSSKRGGELMFGSSPGLNKSFRSRLKAARLNSIVDARVKGNSMRLVVLTMLGLISSVAAGERLAGPQSKYLRCAAVDHILSQQHPDVSQRGSFKKEMELHGKWASWFYRENHANYMADATVAMKEVQEDVMNKAYATDGFIAEMNSCTALQVRTWDAFASCLGPQPPTDAGKERCTRKAVGL